MAETDQITFEGGETITLRRPMSLKISQEGLPDRDVHLAAGLELEVLEEAPHPIEPERGYCTTEVAEKLTHVVDVTFPNGVEYSWSTGRFTKAGKFVSQPYPEEE